MRRTTGFHSAALVAALFVASSLPAGTLSAQNSPPPYPECNTALITTSQENVNVCDAAVDGVDIFHPVAGLLVTGGNPVLGSFRPLGGFFHFSLTVRATGSKVVTPDLNYDGNGTTVGKGDEIFAPMPQLEAALGLYKGMNGFLAIDLLGSAILIPTTVVDGLSVDPDARKIGDIALGLGYGARVGVFPGKGIIPSVAVSAMRRSVPRIGYGDLTGGDEYEFSTNLDATSLRGTAGYHLGIFDLGAGLGWDKYTGDARITFQDQILLVPRLVTIDLDNSRTMAFASLGLDLSVLKIAAELGYQFAKDKTRKTTFTGNNPVDSRLYASGGIRLAF